MRGFRSTFVLLLVLLGLLGYIYFVEMKKPAAGLADQKQKVFTVASDTIEEIEVKAASGDRTVLKKAGGAWSLAEPVTAKADESEVTGVVTNLASLEIQRVVDENPADLAQFGLATPRVEVAFKKSGAAGSERLLLGDKNATGGEIYAKLAASKRVFLVSSFLESTFDKGTFALRDKTVLAFPRDKVDALETGVEGPEAGVREAGRTVDPGRPGTRSHRPRASGRRDRASPDADDEIHRRRRRRRRGPGEHTASTSRPRPRPWVQAAPVRCWPSARRTAPAASTRAICPSGWS